MEQDQTNTGSAARLTKRIDPSIAYMLDRIVNVYFVGEPDAGDRRWVLVDSGLKGSAERIARAAEEIFGSSRPAAIVLTHGHFDHIGSVRELARRWDVPVYAHELELPYLTGRSSYPPPDPTVGGGAMARMAGLFPRGPIDLGRRVLTLPADGGVPAMHGWRWLHTPGHTAGHVSLFRAEDRVLLAGDAFVTVKQESAIAVFSQRQEVHGPPAYYTTDWPEARRSVERLAALEPTLAATGHGVPMRGERLREELRTLSAEFERLAVPARGRYVHRAAVTDASGVVDVPPPVADPFPKIVATAAIVAVAGVVASRRRHRDDEARDR